MNTTYLWAALALYAVAMFALSPRSTDFGSFFSGRSAEGRAVRLGLLVGSVVISWLFAKSITNAANLGAKYGLVGSVAYAGWYLSIPVAGVVIYQMRERLGIESLGEFVTSKYGRAASLAFTLVIMVRLFNEVWSNSAVVGAYFGDAGSGAYFTGALAFTAVTLLYSLRGGLRSSIMTDALQFGIALFLLVFVLALIVPKSGAEALASSGDWTLRGGVDLLLVGLLQSFSYPFHDPVLTDRGFITDAKSMLKGYLLAGVIAAGFIIVFGLVGVHGKLAGIDTGQDAPLRVAQAFGVGVLVVMSVMMMVSAGSTLDSTLSSFSRAFVVDLGGINESGSSHAPLPRLTRWLAGADTVAVGRATMVVTVLLGSLPLFAGAAILKATTVSGTMVLGLAPIFLLFAWKRPGPAAFHLALWPGVAIGVMVAAKLVPESWAIGDGPYASLLGANVWGTLIVFGGFFVGAFIDAARPRRAAAISGVMALVFAADATAQSAPPSADQGAAPALRSSEDSDAPKKPSGISFSGQTMLRLTTKLADLTRPSTEIYNVRLVGKAGLGDFSFLVEPRFRQSSLRSFSPSNVWLQQAYAQYAPLDGFSISGGLLYNQLGLFWDGSWFGNLPYLNGHKLDPDMNLELAFARDWGRFGLKTWLQLSPGEDGLDGEFHTPAKAALLQLPPDPETTPNHREALSARARIVTSIDLGPFELSPGISAQHSVIDRSAFTNDAGDQVGEGEGSQTVGGAELTLAFWRAKVFGELMVERIQDLSPDELERTYFLAGASIDLFKRDSTWVQKISANASFQTTSYAPENVDEWFLTGQLHLRLNEMIGFTSEYVRWEVDALDEPVVHRIEWILHVYY